MSKVKIEIKHWLSGAVLFEYESENNTLVKTIREANLREANLREADLRGANLRGANLYGADLREAKNADLVFAQTLIVGEGDVIGWKKCQDNLLVKLLIPKEAKRHNATGRKCRAEFADVLEIIDMTDGRKKPTQAKSQHDSEVIYEVGKRMIPHEYDPERFNECAGGIHFFITKIEAENY